MSIIECFAKNFIEVPSDLRSLTNEEVDSGYAAMAADMGCFRIMTADAGDERIVWSRRVIAQINAAKKMFLDLIKSGMVPYKVGVDGNASSKEMKEFDPLAEEVIFVPLKAIAGG